MASSIVYKLFLTLGDIRSNICLNGGRVGACFIGVCSCISNHISVAIEVRSNTGQIFGAVRGGVRSKVALGYFNSSICIAGIRDYNSNIISIRLELTTVNSKFGTVSQSGVVCATVKNKCATGNNNAGVTNSTSSIAGSIELTVSNSHVTCTGHNACAVGDIECTAVNSNVILPRCINTTSDITLALNRTIECTAVNGNGVGIACTVAAIEDYNCIINALEDTIIDCKSCANGACVAADSTFPTGNFCVFNGCLRVGKKTNASIVVRNDFSCLFRVFNGQRATVDNGIIGLGSRGFDSIAIQIQNDSFICRDLQNLKEIGVVNHGNGVIGSCGINCIRNIGESKVTNFSNRIGGGIHIEATLFGRAIDLATEYTTSNVDSGIRSRFFNDRSTFVYKDTTINIQSTFTIGVIPFCISVNNAPSAIINESTTVNCSYVSIEKSMLSIVLESTAVNGQSSIIVIFNSVQATIKSTTIDGHFCATVLNCWLFSVLPLSRTIIPTICNQAGILTISICTLVNSDTGIDCHSAEVL
ncbi:hypothetical protein [Evtepia sp.]|uniref:hypothetical protein n=1 Tax=Evtepia sp. TaxID=2773933 RepID=UPI002E7944EE|nr:hypothetical protein [Evtepia sp.]